MAKQLRIKSSGSAKQFASSAATRSNAEILNPLWGAVRILLVMTAILAGVTGQASAQDSRKRTVLEFANTKCETWTDRRLRAARFADASQMESWALGFVSGVNVSAKDDKASADFLRAADSKAVGAWLDDYCRAHPQQGFVDAVMALTDALKQRDQRK